MTSLLLDVIVTRYFDATLLHVDAAAMLRYFKRTNPLATLPSTVPSLMGKDVEKVNEGAKRSMEEGGTRKRVKYNDYSATERARIGQHAAENGPARAVHHFSKVLDKKVPKTMARRLKAEYLAAMKSRAEESLEDGSVPLVTSVPKMAPGRSLLLGKELDTSVQEYISSMRKVGGVVNTMIVMAAANGIVAAKNPALLAQHGGHIEISK